MPVILSLGIEWETKATSIYPESLLDPFLTLNVGTSSITKLIPLAI